MPLSGCEAAVLSNAANIACRPHSVALPLVQRHRNHHQLAVFALQASYVHAFLVETELVTRVDMSVTVCNPKFVTWPMLDYTVRLH